MYKFINANTKKAWEQTKHVYSEVPNTAKGYEKCRCFMETDYGHKYFISAITEKDYFLHYDVPGQKFSVWFTLNGDEVIITSANDGKSYKAERYLKKYALVVVMAACAIKYDNAVCYVR